MRGGSTLYHATAKNADKTPLRCRLNGKMQTWKTRPDEFRQPAKYGLKQCFDITQHNLHEWVANAVTAHVLGVIAEMRQRGAFVASKCEYAVTMVMRTEEHVVHMHDNEKATPHEIALHYLNNSLVSI